MQLVIAYDIADDRRRVRLHTLLLGYGTPVQESVFECEVTDRQARELKRKVARLVRPPIDLVRYYALCAQCAARTEDLAGLVRPEDPTIVV